MFAFIVAMTLVQSFLTPLGGVSDNIRVEMWRPVIEQYFEVDQVDTALRVMACESGGDPTVKNLHSSASGLFQHLDRYWDDRATAAGFPGASVFDPEANIAASAWLQQNHGWFHWSCY